MPTLRPPKWLTRRRSSQDAEARHMPLSPSGRSVSVPGLAVLEGCRGMAAGKKFWTVELELEDGQFTEDATVSVENGTTFYAQTVTFSVYKMTAKNRNIVRLLTQNRLMVIVQDADDVYHLAGETRAMHLTASASTSARGWEVFTSPGDTKSDLLATMIGEEVKDATPGWVHRHDYSDGDLDREARFQMLTATTVPAVLTENGFFTNYNDAVLMIDREWQEAVAKAHAKGILEYAIKQGVEW